MYKKLNAIIFLNDDVDIIESESPIPKPLSPLNVSIPKPIFPGTYSPHLSS